MLRVKNWEEFQHYKDRNPTWIKLHKRLLDDFGFFLLPVASRALAPCIWLLASEYSDGIITATRDEIAFRLRLSREEIDSAIKPLIEKGFIIDDSDMLADCYHYASPRALARDRDRERDRQEKDISRKKSTIEKPESVTQQTWDDFIAHRKNKKAPLTKTALDGIIRESTKCGWNLEKALAECCARGWTGFKAEWVEKEKSKGGQGAGRITL